MVNEVEVTLPQSQNPNNIGVPVPVSRAQWKSSFKVADFDVPSPRDEDWRFTPLARVRDFFGDVASGVTPTVTADGIALDKVPMTDKRLGLLKAPDNRPAALAWEASSDAYVATIPANAELEHEATISVVGSDDSAVAPLQILLDAGANSHGTVILHHTGHARVTEGVEVNVGDGANITFVSIQDWADSAAQMLSFRLRVGRDATFKHIVVTLGGDVVRVTTALDYSAPGGDAELIGTYFADAGQHLEHRLFVDHNQPKTRSNAVYKGALQGDGAHSVWIGDVLIRPEAEGIETYELNRNLVLTEGARADSVPNLEIETGNIEGAGHAAATGRFDDEQLFYLRSRGIPEKEARRLVVMGFFAELINQIGVESVQEKLLAHIDAELGSSLEETTQSNEA